MILWNIALSAYSSSRCVGFTSPDITANSSMSWRLRVRARLTDSPTSNLGERAVLDEDPGFAHRMAAVISSSCRAPRRLL
jgi:hypothetical protein